MARLQPTASTGEVYHPKQRTGRPPVKLPPAPPFHFAAHPHRWSVMGDRLLPELRRIAHVDGLDGQSRGNWRTPVTAAESRGWVVIPHDVDGEGTNYIRVHQGYAGRIHTDRWTQCFAGSEQVRSDATGYREWLQGLVDRGLVPEPPLYVMERLADTLRERADRYAAAAHANPSIKARADRCEADWRVVTAAIEARLQDAEPAEGSVPQIEAAPPTVTKRVAK